MCCCRSPPHRHPLRRGVVVLGIQLALRWKVCEFVLQVSVASGGARWDFVAEIERIHTDAEGEVLIDARWFYRPVRRPTCGRRPAALHPSFHLAFQSIARTPGIAYASPITDACFTSHVDPSQEETAMGRQPWHGADEVRSLLCSLVCARSYEPSSLSRC